MPRSVSLPRTVRGKRPDFFDTPGVDDALSMIVVLAQEVAVLRDPSWNLSHLAAIGARLYAIGGIRGRQGGQLLIFDVSNPRQPTLVATHALEGMDYPLQLAASDRFVVVAGSFDLRVLDPTDPSHLVQVAATSRFERLGDVLIVGHDLFIGGSFLGLWILRLTVP